MKTNPEKKLRVAVIDGQGGNIGRAIVFAINERLGEICREIYPDSPDGHESEIIDLTVIGTNSAATENMSKSRFPGMKLATGENAVAVAARKADVIIGAVGIVMSDSMLGEITPRIALAVTRSDATRILIPLNKTACGCYVAGVGTQKLSDLIRDARDHLFALVSQSGVIIN